MKKLRLGRFTPGNSLIHQLDARTKLLAGLVMIIVILLDDSWLVLVSNTLLIIISICLARINFRSVLHGVKWLWILFIITFFFQCICTPGNAWFSIGPIQVSGDGVYLGIATFFRLLVIYLSSTLLTMTTSPMQLAGGLEYLFTPLKYIKVPVSQIAMLISISLRFIPTIIEEAEMISNAQKARGAPFNSTKKMVRLKTCLAVLIPLVANSLKRASDLAVAMESRCYTGEANYSRIKKLHFSINDLWAIIIIIIICFLPLIYCSGL